MNTYEIVRETWLTRKPAPLSALIAAGSTVALTLGSVFYLLDIGSAASWMDASGHSVFEKHQYWRLWTTLFAHSDVGHLAANSLLFFVLGFFLNAYFGTRIFPLAAFFFGGVTNYLALLSYDPDIVLIGASGVVYWMGGAWLMLYFFLSRQKNFTHRWLRSLGVAILIFMPAETFEPRVSYRTHFIGFFLGAVFGAMLFFKNRALYRSAERRELVHEDLDPGDDLPPPDGF